MNIKQSFLLAMAAVGFAAQAATIDLASDNGTGFAALIGVKNATTQAAADAWNYPYYFDGALYRSIAATPLSAQSDYSAYLPNGAVVQGQDKTASNFASLSAGALSYDATQLTGQGTEVIGVSGLTLAINSQGFSPNSSGYNTGSGVGDFPFNYAITASNLTGTGLTFSNGQLVSIDLDATITVNVQFGTLPYYFTEIGSTTRANYVGNLAISGNQYAFDLDVTKSVNSPLGQLNNTHLVLNRAGSIAAVTAVPEPTTYALLGAGLAVMSLMVRRQRRVQA